MCSLLGRLFGRENIISFGSWAWLISWGSLMVSLALLIVGIRCFIRLLIDGRSWSCCLFYALYLCWILNVLGCFAKWIRFKDDESCLDYRFRWCFSANEPYSTAFPSVCLSFQLNYSSLVSVSCYWLAQYGWYHFSRGYSWSYSLSIKPSE